MFGKISPGIGKTRVTAACNLCGTNEATIIFTLRDRLGLTNGEFQIVQCSNCSLIYVTPLPSLKELERFYPKGYCSHFDKKSIRGQLEKFWCHSRIRKQIIPFTRILPSGGKILDVGCGRGEALYLLHQLGFEPYGIDLNKEAIDYARSAYHLNISQGTLFDVRFEDSFFDGVMFIHSLEHVIEPKETLAEAYRIIKPGGHLLIEVPNIESIQAAIFKERWLGLDVPRHITHWTPETLSTMMEKVGFRVEKIKYASCHISNWFIVLSLAPNLDPMFDSLYRRNPWINRISFLMWYIICLPLALGEVLCQRGGIMSAVVVKPD